MIRALLLPLILAGCCANPEVIIDTQEVYIPVYEPCQVDMPRHVSYETESLSKDSSDFEKIRALLVERRQRMVTEGELRLLLDACTARLNTSPG